jgi:hypothetical protein
MGIHQDRRECRKLGTVMSATAVRRILRRRPAQLCTGAASPAGRSDANRAARGRLVRCLAGERTPPSAADTCKSSLRMTLRGGPVVRPWTADAF